FLRNGGAEMIRILVADDHELVRRGIMSVLEEAHPDWRIVGEATNGQEALELGEALRPDVAILDLSMPLVNGLTVTEHLCRTQPGIHVLVLTVHMAEPVMRQLRSAGARCFLAKGEAPFTLVAAIERMLAGAPFFASATASRPPSRLEPDEYIPIQYLLTRRELDVLRHLTEGLSNKAVAAELDMSVRTVESHRADIIVRLSAESLGDLVRLAIRDGVDMRQSRLHG
ncbi:MAG: response regulator transcription factor, partial [Acidobacteriota bacterium]